MLCDLDTPKMTTQSAASWGYFSTETDEWNKKILETNLFPIHLLPDIVQPGALAGNLKRSWHGIRSGIPVGL
jgi:sedoheptulokinase